MNNIDVKIEVDPDRTVVTITVDGDYHTGLYQSFDLKDDTVYMNETPPCHDVVERENNYTELLITINNQIGGLIRFLRNYAGRYISEDQYNVVVKQISLTWPTDLPWPTDIPRPTPNKSEAAE